MPDYIYHLKSGKTMTVKQDTMPDDDDVIATAKEHGEEVLPADAIVPNKETDMTIPKAEESKTIDLPKPIDLPQDTPTAPPKPQEKGWLGKAWDAINEPLTDLPSRAAQSISDAITQPSPDATDSLWTRAKGFGAGTIEGIGHVLTGATSPTNLAAMALTGGSSLAEKQGLETIAGALSMGARATGVPMIGAGTKDVFSKDSTLAQRAQGLAQIAGGLAAMHGIPESEGMPKPAVENPVEFGANPFPNKGLGKPKIQLSPEAEAAKSVGKTTTDAANTVNQNKGAAVADAANAESDFIDPHSQYRNAPVGTKFTIDPGNMNRTKLNNFIDLGYDYHGLNDAGKIVIEKVKDSPDVKEFKPKNFKSNIAVDALNTPRTLLASMDYSAPLRQGALLIHRKEFWSSLDDMFKAGGSEAGYEAVQKSIRADPMFKKIVAADGSITPSFAEQSGLKLTDLHGMSTREESMMSQLAESIPGVKASNRAFTGYINKLRADTFKSMINDYSKYGGDVRNNLPLARDIAEYVNTSTGRGSLGKLESSAGALSTVLFSPRLIASRLGMMSKGAQALFSPEVYMMSQPSVRREYLKSLFGLAGTAGVVLGLGKLAGGSVEFDPASADFMKLKLGNTRIDPGAGHQQYIVAAQRLMPDLNKIGIPLGGRMKSTNTGIEYDLSNPKYGQSDRFDTAERFLRSKVNPVIGFAWSLMRHQRELDGSKMNFTAWNPFDLRDGHNLTDNSIAQRFIPLVQQDIFNLVREEGITPKTITAGAASTFGMGVQQYKKQRPH